MERKKEEKIKCEKCGRAFGYIRNDDTEFKCRSCGHVTDLENSEHKEE